MPQPPPLLPSDRRAFPWTSRVFSENKQKHITLSPRLKAVTTETTRQILLQAPAVACQLLAHSDRQLKVCLYFRGNGHFLQSLYTGIIQSETPLLSVLYVRETNWWLHQV